MNIFSGYGITKKTSRQREGAFPLSGNGEFLKQLRGREQRFREARARHNKVLEEMREAGHEPDLDLAHPPPGIALLETLYQEGHLREKPFTSVSVETEGATA